MGHHGNSFLSFGAPVAAVGGWVELGRATAVSPTVSSLADKRYYMLLLSPIANGTGDETISIRTGNGSVDSGNNYARRIENNGTTDAISVSQTSLNDMSNTVGNAAVSPSIGVSYVSNLSAKEKLFNYQAVGIRAGPGAGNVPWRTQGVGKWVNTSNPIDVFNIFVNAGTWTAATELVVLGWDPTDTHTTNFWEELASVDLSGGEATSLSTGTFTPKKYLWVQVYGEPTTSDNPILRVGNGSVDSGTSYAGRTSSNGGSDTSDASRTQIENFLSGTANTATFVNMFIVNNASFEKPMIYDNAQEVGAGASQVPSRRESAWKWTNTSNQINIMELSDGGNLATKTAMKVWGSD